MLADLAETQATNFSCPLRSPQLRLASTTPAGGRWGGTHGEGSASSPSNRPRKSQWSGLNILVNDASTRGSRRGSEKTHVASFASRGLGKPGGVESGRIGWGDGILAQMPSPLQLLTIPTLLYLPYLVHVHFAQRRVANRPLLSTPRNTNPPTAARV